MEHLPTAKEFCRQRYNESDPTISWINFNEMVMVEFAKLHVEQALKVASENAKASLGKDWIRKEETIHPEQLVDSITIRVNKDSILNSYPLTNIK